MAAAVLAMRRGAEHAARDHVARAREILPNLEDREGMGVGPGLAEVLTSHGDAAGAFALIERGLPFNTIDARALDELMVWGARASADLVQGASDHRHQSAVQAHREALTRLVKTRETLPGIAFQPSGPDDTVQLARAALFAAESGRAEGIQDQIGMWREAVAACSTAGLGWEEQTGSWRLAAALIGSGAPGTEAAELLRGVHAYAGRQGAAPLEARVEELAASARISLTSPRCPPLGRARRLCRTNSARDRGTRPPGREPDERRDRRGALHQREDRERARLEPAAQDRHRVTPRGRRARPTRGVGHRRMRGRTGRPPMTATVLTVRAYRTTYPIQSCA